MDSSDLDKEEILELLEQARFELSHQKKEVAFQKDLLTEYELEVALLHDRNTKLEEELKRAEKNKTRLQQDSIQVASWSSETDAVRHSCDEGLDDGSCSSDSSDRDFPSLNSFGQNQFVSSKPQSQPKQLPTRCSASSDSFEDEGTAQPRPCVDCSQCRLNDIERDELLDEIHELRDQIVKFKEVNANLLVEADHKSRQIAELTGELLALKSSYNELDNEVKHLQHEKALFEKDVADISEQRKTSSLSRPLDDVGRVRTFSIGSSIGDELGLTRRHVNFGESLDYKEFSDRGEISNSFIQESPTEAFSHEEDTIRDDVTEQTVETGRDSQTQSIVDTTAEEVKGYTRIDSTTGDSGAPQNFSHWTKPFERSIPWPTSIFTCCGGPQAGSLPASRVKRQRDRGFLRKLLRWGPSTRGVKSRRNKQPLVFEDLQY